MPDSVVCFPQANTEQKQDGSNTGASRSLRFFGIASDASARPAVHNSKVGSPYGMFLLCRASGARLSMQGTFIAAQLLNYGHAWHLSVCLPCELHSCYHSRTCHAFCGAHRSSAVAPNTRTGKVRAVAHLSGPCWRDQDQLLQCCSSGTIAASSEHWQQWQMLGHSSTCPSPAAAGTQEGLTCLACRLWCLAVTVLHDL